MIPKSIAQRARDIVQDLQDRSLLSPELRPHLGLIDVEFLLSAERANLLRPLETVLRRRILEWNAGAGTLTRFLGEAGFTVVAYEPDIDLAEATRLRCADLPGIEVHTSAPTGQSFDTIIATGVTPDVLPSLRALLRDGGVLVLAVENALGMSALAGAPYPPEITAQRVAGLADWLAGLKDYGFGDARQLFPFPDDRLPSLILTEAAFTRPGFNATTLIRSSLAGSPGMDKLRSFSEEAIWLVALRNRLGQMLAPSLLLICGADVPADVLAYKYSTQRARAYQKEMRLIAKPDGTAEVWRRSLAPAGSTDYAPIHHRVESEPYHQGEVYFDSLLDLVNHPGWTLPQLQDWAAPWIEFLTSRATAEGRVAPEMFDCLPSNVVRQPNGQFVSFDLEYAPADPPLLSHVMFRGVLSSLRRLRNCAAPAEGTPPRLVRLSTILSGISDAEAEQFVEAEATFQQAVAGGDPVEVQRQLQKATLPIRASVEGALAQRRQMVEQIETYHEALDSAAAEMGRLHERLKHYHQEVDELSESHTKITAELFDYHQKMESVGAENNHLHATLGNYHHHVLNLEAIRSTQAAEIEQARQETRQAREETERVRAGLAVAERDKLRATQQIDALARPLEQLRVLYLSDMLSAPYRYRCEHAVEQLRADGTVADVAMINHPGLIDLIGQYSVLVLFRLSWNDTVAQVIAAARRQNISLVFDIDDLLFEGAVTQELPFLQHKPMSDQMRYHQTALRIRRTLLECDWFLGSTPALVEAAKAFLPAFEHPNLLPDELVENSSRIRRLTSIARRHRFIGYLSGSDTHDQDLESIAPALLRVMQKDADVLLVLGGFIEPPAALQAVSGRVLRAPFLHWKVLPYLQAMFSVNLAPLAGVNRFTEAKSPLKFFEAAILGVPTVATPTGPLRAAIRHGKTGFLAENEDGWVAGIRACLNPKTNARIGEAARASAIEQFSPTAHRRELQQLLRRFVQPNWEMPADPAPPRPIHAMLHDVPSTTLAYFEGNPQELKRQVRHLLKASLSPYRLDAGAWWQPYKEQVLPVCVDPGSPDVTTGSLPAEVVNNPQPVVLIADWTPNSEIKREGEDRYRSTGEDPHFVSSYFEAYAPDLQYLVITLQYPDEARTGVARVYWGGEQNEFFEEKFALDFPVYLDGQSHTYVVDLSRWHNGGNTPWRESGKVRIMRFDPMTKPGAFRFGTVGLR